MTLAFELVDAHQHFWDPLANYHPWLRDEPPIPFRYGNYAALKRRYLPPDYLAEAAPYRITRTVYIETEWDPTDPRGEMAYVDSMRKQFALPTVAIAQAWLDRPDCASVLEAHAARPFVRGIRHKPRANAKPADTTPGGMADPAWRRGYEVLGQLGLHFELQTPWWHLHEAALLAGDFPRIPIILNHTGLPADRSPEGIAGWQRAMQALAACPNVAVKISGLGQAGVPWTAAANRNIVLATIDMFGLDRAMFASNFPVDGLCGTFTAVFGGFDEITRGFSTPERQALFRDNAVRHYRMNA